MKNGKMVLTFLLENNIALLLLMVLDIVPINLKISLQCVVSIRGIISFVLTRSQEFYSQDYFQNEQIENIFGTHVFTPSHTSVAESPNHNIYKN